MYGAVLECVRGGSDVEGYGSAAAGVYEGEQWYTVDLWISILACVSATYAIYCLITFYLSMQEELEASVSNALAKFLCVKVSLS